jgi:hypothetical protein
VFVDGALGRALAAQARDRLGTAKLGTPVRDESAADPCHVVPGGQASSSRDPAEPREIP